MYYHPTLHFLSALKLLGFEYYQSAFMESKIQLNSLYQSESRKETMVNAKDLAENTHAQAHARTHAYTHTHMHTHTDIISLQKGLEN